MGILIAGLLLWAAAHVFKRVAPGVRAGWGEPGKGIIAGAVLVALGLMIWGYLRAPYLSVYTPVAGAGHLNNLAMFAALYLYGVGQSRGLLSHRIRHPMLIGTALWGGAHLLVNGDAASILLFGGIAVWALAEIVVVNRTTAPWSPKGLVSARGDLVNVAVTVVVYAVVAALHIWLGRNPFLGTYG